MAEQGGAMYFPDDERAAAEFDALAEQLGGVDVLRKHQAIMIADIVRGEQLKDELRQDIQDRGLTYKEHNGRQTYQRENKSVTTLLKVIDQQRRTMQALGLIAATKAQPESQDDGDFDSF